MRKLVVSVFISLDGVIQGPGGAEEDTTTGAATPAVWHAPPHGPQRRDTA